MPRQGRISSIAHFISERCCRHPGLSVGSGPACWGYSRWLAPIHGFFGGFRAGCWSSRTCAVSSASDVGRTLCGLFRCSRRALNAVVQHFPSSGQFHTWPRRFRSERFPALLGRSDHRSVGLERVALFSAFKGSSPAAMRLLGVNCMTPDFRGGWQHPTTSEKGLKARQNPAGAPRQQECRRPSAAFEQFPWGSVPVVGIGARLLAFRLDEFPGFHGGQLPALS